MQQGNEGRKPRQESSLARSRVQDISPGSSDRCCSLLQQNDSPFNDSKTQRLCPEPTPSYYLEVKTGGHPRHKVNQKEGSLRVLRRFMWMCMP